MYLVWICLILSLANAGFCMHRGPKNQMSKVQENYFDPYAGVDSNRVTVKQKVVNQLQALHQKIQNLPPNAPALVGSIFKLISEVEKLSNQDVGNDIGQVLKVTTALQSNWTLITGKDVAAMGKAVCDVLSVVSTVAIPPPYGIIVSSVVGLIGNLIGTQAGKPKTMSEVVEQVIKKELLQQYTQEMIGRIRGALTALDIYQSFLNGYFVNDKQLSTEDFQVMISPQYDIFRLFELREELMTLIERMAISKKKDIASDTIKLINSYVVLSSMIEVLIHTKKSILERNPNTMLSANNYWNAIERSRKDSQQKLSFLRNPKLDNGVLFASYVSEDNPIVETYLNSVEISTRPLSLPGCFQLANKKDERVSLKRSVSIGSKDAAIFKFPALTNGEYLMEKTTDGLVCSYPDNKFLKVENDCSKKSDRAHFRVYAFADEGFLILNKLWPTRPLWLKEKTLLNGVSKALSVTSAEKEWSEKDPEYVWYMIKIPCDGGDGLVGIKPIE